MSGNYVSGIELYLFGMQMPTGITLNALLGTHMTDKELALNYLCFFHNCEEFVKVEIYYDNIFVKT